MPRDYIPAEDLPYGPGNPDYEHDARRQRDLDDQHAGELPQSEDHHE